MWFCNHDTNQRKSDCVVECSIPALPFILSFIVNLLNYYKTKTERLPQLYQERNILTQKWMALLATLLARTC